MMLKRLFRRGMSCEDVLEVLQSYLDGETDEQTAKAVVAHLDDCEHCEMESDVYRRIKGSLNKQTREVDPEIMAALSKFGEKVARGEVG